MAHDDLTSEARVREAADTGGPLNFGDAGGFEHGLQGGKGGKWGSEREISARVLVELMTTPSGPQGEPPRALRLSGARIIDSLDLAGSQLVRPLILRACCFTDPVTLDETGARTLEFIDCCIPSLSGRRLEARGDLRLTGLYADSVVLEGARIRGLLNLERARLGYPGEPRNGVALDCVRIEVGSEMNCDQLHAEGTVRLERARIGGLLVFSNAVLRPAEGRALFADGLQVDQDMDCRRSVATGEVWLRGHGSQDSCCFLAVPSSPTRELRCARTGFTLKRACFARRMAIGDFTRPVSCGWSAPTFAPT
jgi:hypothetical protein